MKIQFASDLHLEFPENTKYLLENPFKVTGDILILAGDIHVFNNPTFLENPFWDWASKNYKQVIIAFGNHEFYGGLDLSKMENGYKYKIRENVYYYYNCIISFENLDIIVSTLWSYIHKENKSICEKGINDFRLIKFGEQTLNSELYNQEHIKCLDFIKKSLNESKAKIKVVVTHHVPSELLYNSEDNNDLPDYTTIELKEYIKNCGANFWIFGHSHKNNVDTIVGNTSCLCNQFGYLSAKENETFSNDKHIEIE